MNHNGVANQEFEPKEWLLIFALTTGKPWLDRIIPGRFKHVSAAGWVPGARCWIFYDVAWSRTSIKLAPEKDGDLIYAVLQRRAAVLKVKADFETRGSAMMRGGFWCVPAIKHLVGSRSGALRPDRLWRDLLADETRAKVFSYAASAGTAGSDSAGEGGSAGGERREIGSDPGHAAA